MYRFLRTIQSKLIFSYGLTFTLWVLVIIAVFSYNMYHTLTQNTERLIQIQTEEVANKIENSNLKAVTIAKTMALAQESGLFGDRENSVLFARNVLLKNQNLTGVSIGYESNADQEDKTYLKNADGPVKQALNDQGRFLPYWFTDPKDNNQMKLAPLIDMETSLYYQGCKDKFFSNSPDKYMITEPYFYEGKMIVEHTFPISINGKFMGITGVDRALTDIHLFLKVLKPFKTAGFALLTGEGRIISSTFPLISSETLTQFKQQLKLEYEENEQAQADLEQIDQRMLTRQLEETDYKEILQSLNNLKTTRFFYQPDPIDNQIHLFSATRIQTGNWILVMRVAQNEIMIPIKQTLVQVMVVSLIGLLVTFIILIWQARKISQPIVKAVTVAEQVAEGDFTARINVRPSDETGHLLNAIRTMIDCLKSLIGQIQRSGIQVTSSTTELAATAKEQKATMVNQVEFTHQVEKSVENISTVATNLVKTMQQVTFMLTETAEFANTGQTNLSRMADSMSQMEEASSSISNRLNTINEKTENITSVVTTITKVADQTNLLSLNAAIEAEKAGEYGRGFNVVAQEIRRLADQTAVATLDIEQMVKDMQAAVSAGVTEMDRFIADVQQSAEDVSKTSTQLALIIEQVQALLPRFEEINEAMNNQSKHAQQINTAMVEVSQGMRQTTESLEESFRAIEQLNEAAKVLQNEVSRFRIH